MRAGHVIAAIIPALNEGESIPLVLADLPDWVDHVIVVDNGSTDRTAHVAHDNGAIVINEPHRGYGAACQRGITVAVQQTPIPDILLFLDADYSDHADLAGSIIDPITRDGADLVVGCRSPQLTEKGALQPQQRFGNWLACSLIRLLWQQPITDLGPFRAITTGALDQLHLSDMNFGWTVDMQISAIRQNLTLVEVPVPYRKRVGQSKISGTVLGSIKAGAKILFCVGRAALSNPKKSSKERRTPSTLKSRTETSSNRPKG